jgi:hypothetical protein
MHTAVAAKTKQQRCLVAPNPTQMAARPGSRVAMAAVYVNGVATNSLA